MLKKKKKFVFLFLIVNISFSKMVFRGNLYINTKDDTNLQENVYKIHEAPASTANAPLLNLNLNYEKLRYKVTDI